MIKPLAIMSRKSMETGEIPENWRKGIIVPIYKKNNKPSEAASYRPICLTSIISKIIAFFFA